MAAKLIADELILLAAHPANDGWPAGADGMPWVPPYLEHAVAVALLAELALMGAVTVERDRVAATGHEVRGEPELAETAAMVTAEPRLRSPAWWATRVAATAPERRRLVVLRRENVGPRTDRGPAGRRPRGAPSPLAPLLPCQGPEHLNCQARVGRVAPTPTSTGRAYPHDSCTQPP